MAGRRRRRRKEEGGGARGEGDREGRRRGEDRREGGRAQRSDTPPQHMLRLGQDQGEEEEEDGGRGAKERSGGVVEQSCFARAVETMGGLRHRVVGPSGLRPGERECCVFGTCETALGKLACGSQRSSVQSSTLSQKHNCQMFRSYPRLIWSDTASRVSEVERRAGSVL